MSSPEFWKDIKDYEKLYQVSNLGRVRSLNHLASNGITKSLYKWSKELNYSYNQLRWLYDKGGDLPNGWKRKSL